jgi:glucose/arabinose dehydrogenase
LDNWHWVKKHSKFSDLPATMLKLLGYRFDTPNPFAGIFGGADIAVTAPFSAFGVSNQTRIPPAPNDKPTSAIYSLSPEGGDLRVEAWGIRVPRGLAFNEYSNLYMTNNGMELRGTRPIKDDPDVLLKWSRDTWYGFPDFSADLFPISEPRFQPPPERIQRHGYPEVSALIDHAASALSNPTAFRRTLVFGVFPALSGAAKLDFAPSSGPFREFRGNAIIAMSGDRAPFATSGLPLREPVGYKVVRLDLDTQQAEDFIRNTQGGPGSAIRTRSPLLERPIDAKFAPDGTLYILDFGRMQMRGGSVRVSPGTGKVFVLKPIETPPEPTTAASR